MQNDQTLSVQKAEFYKEIDKRIAALSTLKKNSCVLTDHLFEDIYNFMVSLQNMTKSDFEWNQFPIESATKG